MAEKEHTFSITEVTFTSGKIASVKVVLDGREIRIPVAADVKAYFNEQFIRQNPTAAQRKRLATVMNLLRAAYKKGLEDRGTKSA